MNAALPHTWWLLALRGAVTLLFGIAAVIWPAITLLTLAALFAAYAIIAGALWVLGAVRNRPADPRWWVLLVLGACSIAAGVAAALYPAMTTVVLVLLIGANALVTGVIDIIVAIRVRRHIKGELLLLLAGIASVLFGAVVLLYPMGAGALALAWMIGLYAIAIGSMMLALALQVRTWSRIGIARPGGA